MGGTFSAHGKKPVRTPKHRWKDNINLDHKELEQEVMDWINLAKDRGQWHTVVKLVTRLHIP
jgi:hypothetical protein